MWGWTLRPLSLLPIVAVLLLTGCLPVSLRPLYSEHDLYFDQALLGEWTDSAGAQWRFEPLRDEGEVAKAKAAGVELDLTGVTGYRVTLIDANSRAARFDGRLTKIDGVPFLDLTVAGSEHIGGSGELADVLRIPVHTWVRLDFDNGKFDLRPLNSEWMLQYLQSPRGQTELTHAYINERWPLITDTTHELRQFIARHMDEPGFFAAAGDLTGTKVRQGNSNYDSQYRQATTGGKQGYEAKPAE
jgi:hypothetical protein